jgi:hypothetical protein
MLCSLLWLMRWGLSLMSCLQTVAFHLCIPCMMWEMVSFWPKTYMILSIGFVFITALSCYCWLNFSIYCSYSKVPLGPSATRNPRGYGIHCQSPGSRPRIPHQHVS